MAAKDSCVSVPGLGRHAGSIKNENQDGDDNEEAHDELSLGFKNTIRFHKDILKDWIG
jgi:hypothetical protein